MCFRDAADGYAFKDREGARTPVTADEREGHDEADNKDEKVEVRKDFPSCDVFWASACEGPEEEQGEEEWNGEKGRDAVA